MCLLFSLWAVRQRQEGGFTNDVGREVEMCSLRSPNPRDAKFGLGGASSLSLFSRFAIFILPLFSFPRLQDSLIQHFLQLYQVPRYHCVSTASIDQDPHGAMSSPSPEEPKRTAIETAKQWGGKQLSLPSQRPVLMIFRISAETSHRKSTSTRGPGDSSLCPACSTSAIDAHDLSTAAPRLYVSQPPGLQD